MTLSQVSLSSANWWENKRELGNGIEMDFLNGTLVYSRQFHNSIRGHNCTPNKILLVYSTIEKPQFKMLCGEKLGESSVTSTRRKIPRVSIFHVHHFPFFLSLSSSVWANAVKDNKHLILILIKTDWHHAERSFNGLANQLSTYRRK